jgi:hypothetical protein
MKRAAGLFLAGLVISGCATTRVTYPMTFDCQAMRLAPVTNPTQRLEFRSQGISVLPPPGDRWCIQDSGPKGVGFLTHPLLGKRLEAAPSQAEIAHTFATLVIADAAPKDVKVDTPEDLLAMAERMTRSEGNLKTLESRVARDTSLGAECVRFDYVVEERNNPNVRGLVLVLVNREFLCRHPSAQPPILVIIGASERYLQGTVSEPPLIESLRPEWEVFVRSLQFMPPR